MNQLYRFFILSLFLFCSALLAAQTTTVPFNFTGAEQTWVVPPGITSVLIKAYGAQGGNGNVVVVGTGGRGGYAAGFLAVTPGQTLYIYVGGQGSTENDNNSTTSGGGGYNGGGNANGATGGVLSAPRRRGGGGGASDVRSGGNALVNRVIVAAGGGGGGNLITGGAGGGLTGSGILFGANGGSQTAGGSGGSTCPDGSLGLGGQAGATAGCSGGGGGYYGGEAGNGGGGGSSYLGGVTDGITVGDTRTGNGLIEICYGPDLASASQDELDFLADALAICVDSFSGVTTQFTDDFESYAYHNSLFDGPAFSGNGFTVSLVESGLAAGNFQVGSFFGNRALRIQADSFNLLGSGEDLICITFDEPVNAVGARFLAVDLNAFGHEGIKVQAVLDMMDGTQDILELQPQSGALVFTGGYFGLFQREGCNKIAKLTFRVSGVNSNVLSAVQLGLSLYLDNLFFNTCDCSCELGSCISLVNVSLDGNCTRYLQPLDLMTNVSIGCSNNGFTLMVLDQRGKNLGPQVGFGQIGQTLTYKIIENGTQNSCWGYLKVEDKAPPLINRKTRDTLPCLDDSYQDAILVSNSGCDGYYNFPGKINFISKRYEDFGCDDPEFTGRILREFRVSDLWGNSGVFRDTIYLWKLSAANLVCPPDTSVDCAAEVSEADNSKKDIVWSSRFYTGEDGYRHPYPTDYSPVPSNNYEYAFPAPGIWYTIPGRPRDTVYMSDAEAFGSHGKCNIVYKYEDMVIPSCGSSYKIRRVWNIYDWCAKLDTTCVQWIKISDTTEPILDDKYLGICIGIRSIFSDYCIDEKYWGHATVDPHQCSAHVTIPDIRPWMTAKSKACDPQVKETYTLDYMDPAHQGKTISLHGEVSAGGAHIYLPEGLHKVQITLTDDCWNQSTFSWWVEVQDHTPPTPVCDAHTVITLDPDKCWAKINARDLDDGSSDNCCDNLHFAVARMADIEAYTIKWNDIFKACYGDHYGLHKSEIDSFINIWINCFLFSDTLELSQCGSETLVLRVYENCYASHYDAHLFPGTEHQWYCYNLSDDYAAWFWWQLDKYKGYGNPKPGIYCDYTQGANHFGWTIDENSSTPVPYKVYRDLCPPDPSGEYGVACISEVFYLTAAETVVETSCLDNNPLYHLNDFSFDFLTADDEKEWNKRVAGLVNGDWTGPCAQDVNILEDLCRTWFKHLWNDCMVDVEKQDKIPPVCAAPPDVTVYCDGVPWDGVIHAGLDQAHYTDADDAWQFCSMTDVYAAGCLFDDNKVDDVTVADPLKWCYKGGAIIDRNGRTQGYYSGPSSGHYPQACESYNYEYTAKPFYCRLWLLLDQFDDPTGARVDALTYLAADDEVKVKECSGYTITHDDTGRLDECGSGTLTRTWTVTEACEPQRTAYCYQKIVVKRRSDFEVCFPADTVVVCDKDNSILDLSRDQFPLVSDDDCELIGINYEDQELVINGIDDQNGCRKILRKWTIIDWCVYNPDQIQHRPDVILDDRLVAGEERPCVIRCLKDDGDGYMEYLQVIKIIDQEIPEVLCNIGDMVVCNTSPECAESDVDVLLGFVNDNCTPKDKVKAWFKLTHESSKAVITGVGTRYQGPLSVGQYQVILWGEDLCSNRASCEFIFEVKDCKAPTPYCRSGVATVIMPSSGTVEVWASDLNANSFDNCTDQDELIFSFDEAGDELSRIFTCADIPNGQKEPVEVQLWVHDAAGNKDFCITYILLQDGIQNACPDGAGASVDNNSLVTADQFSFSHKKQAGKITLELRDAGTDLTSALYQNLPNPFKASTVIGFSLANGGKATLKITDLSGKTIREVSGNFASGYHEVQIDQLEAKGVLYYQLISGEDILTKKMISID